MYGEGAAARHEVLRRLQLIVECSGVKNIVSISTLVVELYIPHLSQQLNHFMVPAYPQRGFETRRKQKKYREKNQ
jgi:hypothetical protein